LTPPNHLAETKESPWARFDSLVDKREARTKPLKQDLIEIPGGLPLQEKNWQVAEIFKTWI
jgi:hypothetical protein